MTFPGRWTVIRKHATRASGTGCHYCATKPTTILLTCTTSAANTAAPSKCFLPRGAPARYRDAYHLALCQLDLSEIYLELNLSEEAREMAHEGFLRFEKLGMGYEAAKTLANEAMAYAQQGKAVQALERFAKAREMFAREKNSVWPWLLDLYQGLVLFHEGRLFEARRLSAGAAEFFDGMPLPGKALLARLLLARI